MQRRNDTDAAAGCAGKQRFDSKGAANRALRAVQRRAPRRSKLLEGVYFCAFCSGFHYGAHTKRPPSKPTQCETIEAGA